MALLLGANVTDRINVGDGASIQNLTAATWAVWVYLTDDTLSERIWVKGSVAGVNRRIFYIEPSPTPSLSVIVSRSTTNLTAKAARANFAAWATNKWLFLAGVFDLAGANGAQKLFVGDLTTLAAEPSAYDGAQVVGSGTTSTDAGATANIGGVGTVPIIGRLATVQVFNRALAVEEIQSLQFWPRAISGCAGFWIMGNDATQPQADYSGNGNAGTVTSATVADHVPLPSAFSYDVTTSGVIAPVIFPPARGSG